jgi:hypothetical protein
MEVVEIYIVEKGRTITNENVLEIVKDLFVSKSDSQEKFPKVCVDDEFYLYPSKLPLDLIPVKEYKSQKKEPKKLQIDLLLIIEENGVKYKPIRYKQPKGEKPIKIKIPKFIWEEYKGRTEKEMLSWYNNKVKDGVSEFVDEKEFIKWYKENMKDGGECYYCGIKEEECQKLIHKGLLTSLRFPIYNNRTQGANRGYYLDIDRKNPTGLYSYKNCVLSCYFCNNDKSDVFNDEEYKKFKENRSGYLRNLLKEE